MQNLGDSATIQLPIDMDLRPKSTSPPCRSQKINCLPLSGSIFNPGDVIKIEVPCGKAGQFLDPSQTYLVLKVKNVDPAYAPFYVDHSAYSFISKIEVFSSSQLIETINGFNLLMSTLMDTQLGPMDRLGVMSQLIGTDEMKPIDAGVGGINFSRGGIPIAPGQTQVFCLPLVSSVIGSGLSKYLPIGDLQDLRLEITLETNANPIISATSTTISTNLWQITQAELALQILTVDADVNNMMHHARGGGPIMISTESYRNYNTVLNAGNNSDSTICPLKFTSCKSLIGAYRTNTNLNTFLNASISSRRNPFASGLANNASVNFQVLIGSDYVPRIPIRTTTEFAIEYQKAFHMINNVNNKSSMTKYVYDQGLEPSNALTNTAGGQLISSTTTIASATVSSLNATTGITTAGVFTTTAAHGLVQGNIIVFTAASANGLGQYQPYYILTVPLSTTFTLSALPNGMPITNATFTGQTYSFVGYTTPVIYWESTPAFAWALNLDSLYQQSQQSMSGTNTQSASCFANATYSLNTPVAMRMDLFAHYDAILIIDPSTKQMSVRI